MLRVARIFENVGAKIKSLAKTFLWIKFIVCLMVVLYCLSVSHTDSFGMLAGVIFFGGLLVSWVSSLLLYGLGELIENSTRIAEQNKQLLDALACHKPADEDEEEE